MRETEFRSYLSRRLGGPSVDSYVAYCNRARRDVGLQLDSDDLSAIGIANIRRALEVAGVPPASVRNCLSALKAYAAFRDGNVQEAGTTSGMKITAEQRQAWIANTADGPFNRWLDAQVRDEDKKFDLERMYALAERYGIQRRTEFAHLNAGQQRMSLGNMLRRRVPASEYEVGTTPVEPPSALAPAPENEPASQPPGAPPPQGISRPQMVREARVSELLVLYGQIMDELRDREVVRTGNSPVGDYAELLFAKAFGWTLESNSSAGHDATDAGGRRYQIKARRLSSPGASRQLGAIRKLHEQTFDDLAAVLFDSSFKLLRAIIIPHAVVTAKARRTDHTNSWLLILDDRLWQAAGARDVTAEIAVAASQI